MRIQYIGSDVLRAKIREMLEGRIDIITGDDADARIFEISSLATLLKITPHFTLPTFFLLTTQESQVVSQLARYQVAGIIFPPVSAETLYGKLKQGMVYRKTSTRRPEDYDTLKAKIIAKAENIPPLPALAQKLVSLTRNDKVSLPEIISHIKQDQGLSAKIIKLVNSPFFGMRQEITSIDRATVLVGTNTVKNLALALSTDQYYNKPFGMYGTSGQGLWKHAYRIARICEEIASVLGENTDAYYLAGLMHDIGKTVLVDFLVKHVANEEQEEKLLGFTHSAVGAFILQKWEVASFIADAVKSHHGQPTDRLPAVLAAANKIDHERRKAAEIVEELCGTIGFNDPAAILARIGVVIEEIADE